MQHRRLTQYKCPRCGNVCAVLGRYKSHISRKHICLPIINDVIPTPSNVIIIKYEGSRASTISGEGSLEIIATSQTHDGTSAEMLGGDASQPKVQVNDGAFEELRAQVRQMATLLSEVKAIISELQAIQAHDHDNKQQHSRDRQ